MLALSIAILLTLVYAALSLRAGAREASLGAPAILLGVGASCAAAAGFGQAGAAVGTAVSAAEMIVAPVVLGMLAAGAIVLARSRTEGVRLWPAAGLVALLGAMALADRVDALSGQLLLVLGLGVLWIATDNRSGDRRGPDAVSVVLSGAVPALAGLAATASVGWAIVAGASAGWATALIALNLLVWVLARRDFSTVATALVIGVCISAGAANLTRIVGGAMRQPEWDGGEQSRAMAMELLSRPYVPGFSGTLPDAVLLVLGILIVVLGTESGTTQRRRRLLLGMLLGVAAMQIGWVVIGAS